MSENKNEENQYQPLVEKLTELRNLLKYTCTYDYDKLGEAIEILTNKEKNNNKKLMNKVRKYLSTDNFFNPRWAYDWFMPNINGKAWGCYVYEIQKLCDKILCNKIENNNDK